MNLAEVLREMAAETGYKVDLPDTQVLSAAADEIDQLRLKLETAVTAREYEYERWAAAERERTELTRKLDEALKRIAELDRLADGLATDCQYHEENEKAAESRLDSCLETNGILHDALIEIVKPLSRPMPLGADKMTAQEMAEIAAKALEHVGPASGTAVETSSPKADQWTPEQMEKWKDATPYTDDELRRGGKALERKPE